MGSRLGRRVIHFANLPIKLLLPSPPFTRLREIAIKTIPSASKIEIRRVLESLYGLHVEEVRTLNMDGKKKHRGAFLAAAPAYKKAYVTLREPLSIDPDLFPVKAVQAERDKIAEAQAKRERAVVEGGGSGRRSHWMDDPDVGLDRRDLPHGPRTPRTTRSSKKESAWKGGPGGRGGPPKKVEEAKFPWSSMQAGASKLGDNASQVSPRCRSSTACPDQTPEPSTDLTSRQPRCLHHDKANGWWFYARS